MKNQNVTIEAYDSHAGQYDQESWQRGTYENIAKLLLGKFKNKLLKIIELGCGSGREAKLLLDLYPEADYLGMDGSPELIRLAKMKVPKAKFVSADFEDFQIPGGVDAIFAFASLLHADRKVMKNMLSQTANSLTSGGIFFMTLQYGDYHKQIRKDEMGERVFYLYTPKDIESILPKGVFDSKFECYELRFKKWLSATLIKK
jgi:trans-aconitate methyltransferase